MNEDFVSSKLARKLQEKGYPLKKVYRQDGAPFFYDLPQDHPDWSQCDAWYLPSIWKALKWLRKKKKISVQPCAQNEFSWTCQISIIEPDDSYTKTWIDDQNSFENSALAGIEYVLDNLI